MGKIPPRLSASPRASSRRRARGRAGGQLYELAWPVLHFLGPPIGGRTPTPTSSIDCGLPNVFRSRGPVGSVWITIA